MRQTTVTRRAMIARINRRLCALGRWEKVTQTHPPRLVKMGSKAVVRELPDAAALEAFARELGCLETWEVLK